MLTTMGRLRRLLRESAGTLTRVEDLKPGDVFVLPGYSGEYAVQRLTNSITDANGRWTLTDFDVKGEDSKQFIAFSNFTNDRSTDLAPGIMSMQEYSVMDRKAKTKSQANYAVMFDHDISPDADSVNALLRNKSQELFSRSWKNFIRVYGITEVQVIDIDERFTVSARTAPKGLKKADLILQVLHDAGEPMSREDILQRVAKLEGKPFVPTSNVSYFAKSNPTSMVRKGLLEPVKVGNRVLYQPTVRVSDIDWRERETTPEDYYAV